MSIFITLPRTKTHSAPGSRPGRVRLWGRGDTAGSAAHTPHTRSRPEGAGSETTIHNISRIADTIPDAGTTAARRTREQSAPGRTDGVCPTPGALQPTGYQGKPSPFRWGLLCLAHWYTHSYAARRRRPCQAKRPDAEPLPPATPVGGRQIYGCPSPGRQNSFRARDRSSRTLPRGKGFQIVGTGLSAVCPGRSGAHGVGAAVLPA